MKLTGWSIKAHGPGNDLRKGMGASGFAEWLNNSRSCKIQPNTAIKRVRAVPFLPRMPQTGCLVTDRRCFPDCLLSHSRDSAAVTGMALHGQGS
jgi:hypothetical protein